MHRLTNFLIAGLLISGGAITAACQLSPSVTNTQIAPPGRDQTNGCSENNSIDYLESLHAFTSHVRYHHPSHGVERTDWGQFLRYASMRALQMKTPGEYTSLIEELFLPIAPELFLTTTDDESVYSFEKTEKVAVYYQNGYIDELDQRRSVFKREHRQIPVDEFRTTAHYPPQDIYHYQDSCLDIQIPTVVGLKNGDDIVESRPFSEHLEESLHKSSSAEHGCFARMGKIWGAIMHFYPHHADIDTNWENELRPLLMSCIDYDEDRNHSALLKSLTKLEDNHARVLNAENENIKSGYTVSVHFDLIEDKVAVVATEGEVTHVEPGDYLVEINGRDIESLLSERLPYSLRAPNRAPHSVIHFDMIRGEKGEKFTLEFQRPDGSRYETHLTVDRAIPIDNDDRDQLPRVPLSANVDLGNGIRYINVPQIDIDDFDSILDDLESAKGIVLDLRSFPTNWSVWTRLVSHLSATDIPSPPMYLHYANWPDYRDRHVSPVPDQTIRARSPTLSAPAVALASRYSLSGNEYALAYLENAGVDIVGERTYGVNGNMTRIIAGEANDNARLTVTFTGLEVRQNDGSRLLGRGIHPSVTVEPTLDSIRSNTDTHLAAAVKHLTDLQPSTLTHDISN